MKIVALRLYFHKNQVVTVFVGNIPKAVYNSAKKRMLKTVRKRFLFRNNPNQLGISLFCPAIIFCLSVLKTGKLCG